jgi:hypothetical protein
MSAGVMEGSEDEKKKHREIEKELKEVSCTLYVNEKRIIQIAIRIQAKTKMTHQVKVNGAVEVTKH